MSLIDNFSGRPLPLKVEAFACAVVISKVLKMDHVKISNFKF